MNVLLVKAIAVLAAISLSLDVSALMDYAFDIVNKFWPLLVVLLGLMLGFALIKWFPNLFKNIISGLGGK